MKATTESKRVPYVPQIDGLRAIAVVAVMIFHLRASWLPGGFAGVDLFFVVSGYVISRSMLDAGTSGLGSFIGRFYSRRVLRILPALLVCVFASFVLTTILVPSAWLSWTNFQTARYSLWGLGNYGLLNAGDSYFAPRIEYNPFAHTWSLGVEEQFYVLFPLVFFAWLTLRQREHGRQSLGTALLAVLAMASLICSAYVSSHDPQQAYYTLPSRFWELALGGLLFQLHASGLQLAGDQPTRAGLELLASLVLVGIGLAASDSNAFPFPWALPVVLGTVGCIDAVTAPNADKSRVCSWLGLPPFVWLGRRSYSLYLWHWPIYVLFRWTVGLDRPPEMLAAVVITVVISSASYSWIETPFRRGPLSRRTNNAYLALAGVASICVVYKTTSFVQLYRERLSASVVTRNAAIWYPHDWAPLNVGAPGTCVETAQRAQAGGGTVELLDASSCRTAGRSPARTTNVFVVGNSHAGAYRTLLSRLTRSEPFTVRVYISTTCPFLPLDDTTMGASGQCGTFVHGVLADIRSLAHPGDIVFLPSLRLPRLSNQWGQYSEAGRSTLVGPDATRRRLAATDEAYRVLRPVLAEGISVVFEAPKPIFLAPAFRCSDWFNHSNPVCAPGLTISRDFMLTYREPVLRSMETLAARDSAIVIWDPFELLCPQSTCRAVVGGEPLFFDADHLSSHANDLLYPSFLDFVHQLASGTRTMALK